MTEVILDTLAKLMECNPSQIAEALQGQDITLDQLLAFHSKLCDIITRDMGAGMYSHPTGI